MNFNENAKFIPNGFKGSNIKMSELEKYFDFVNYNNSFYLMCFNEIFKKNLSERLFDKSEDTTLMNYRLLNNTIIKKISDDEYHFVGQIDEPCIFLQYAKVSKEKGWIKLLEYEKSSLSVPQEHDKSPLYYYADMAHSVFTRARGTYYCIFYNENGIYAASRKGMYRIDKERDNELDAYTVDALLYIFALTTVVYGETDRSNHYSNTFITACVRTPSDVMFNDSLKYDVTFISGYISYPFFYIKSHCRKHFTGVSRIGDANIQYPTKLWHKYLVDYEKREKSIDLYSQLEVYSSKFKTTMVISNDDNHIVEFLTSNSMKIVDVAQKLIELQQKGEIAMNQYNLTKTFTVKDIMRFANDMFRKNRILNEILQSYYKITTFKADYNAFKSFMYCCYQKLMNRDINKSVVELLKDKLPEKRFDFYDVEEINVTTPLSIGEQYVIQNDMNKKFTIVKLDKNECQIKRENFIITCSIKEEIGLYTLTPQLETVEFEIALGDKYSSDISNIMRNLTDQYERRIPEYTLTIENSTILPPYKYQIPDNLREKILVFLYFGKDRKYSHVSSEIVDDFFSSNMVLAKNNSSIRTSNNVQIDDYDLTYGDNVLSITNVFDVPVGIKKVKRYTKVKNLHNVPTPPSLFYIIVGNRVDLIEGKDEYAMSEGFQNWIKSEHLIKELKFNKIFLFRELNAPVVQKTQNRMELYTYTSNQQLEYGEVSTLKMLFN